MNVFYLRPLQNPNAETVAQSNGLLQHLEDAETVEFEIRDEEPGVKTLYRWSSSLDTYKY